MRTGRLLVTSHLACVLAGCAASPEANALPTSRPARLPPSLSTLPRKAAGKRFDLPLARLFVPERFACPEGGEVPVFVHFQGGPVIAEENFVRMGRPGVLIASTISGLSSAFAAPYRDPAAFKQLLQAAMRALERETGATGLRPGPITITFFSAGYGAVRELLKDEELFGRITALVSADSIYADVVSPSVRAPRIEQMAGFMRFAQAAARGEKTFVVAHGAQRTTYASTAETAELLLAAVGGKREAVTGRFTSRGIPIATRCSVGNFHLYGFEEDGPTIHGDILYMIEELARAHLPQLRGDGPRPTSGPATR